MRRTLALIGTEPTARIAVVAAADWPPLQQDLRPRHSGYPAAIDGYAQP